MQRFNKKIFIQFINSQSYRKIFLEYWWVVLFVVGSYVLFTQSLIRKQSEIYALQNRKSELIAKIQQANGERKNLQMQVNSQDDPYWIELTLKRCLGVVPKKQVKIFFKKEQ